MKKSVHLCLLLYICGILQKGWSQKQCEVQVVSTQVFAPFDEWVLLNCTYTCSKPSWESRLRKRNITEGDHWVSTEVLVNDWETSRISCISEDEENVLESIVTVAAYALPSKVTIDLEEELEEGQRHEVTCTVFDVAPLANLKISVIREGTVIRTLTFAEDTVTGKQTLSESFYFEPSRRDNLQDFYCQAALELGTVGDYMVQSKKINVKTFARPQLPTISIKPTTAKEGDSVTLTCHSEGLPEPEYSWELPTDAHVTYSEDKSIINIAKVTVAYNGKYLCMAKNKHGRVREEKFLDVIKNPGAQPDTPFFMVLPGETVKEGDSLNLTCRSNGFPEPEYVWIIPSKDRVSFSADKSKIFIRKTTSAHNGTYACEAQNTHGKVRKQVVVKIIGQPNGSFNTRPATILLPSVLVFILALL
ncbi:vascular cell adhesion protein 1-like isoform X2 [Rana temporaria]|uniref:vascular cell adhesion protein 1-like isoform X2 n=1 Tax=Rana temporaria TaxID=8407 RepID=UPI001AAD3290|nr:vascular cell adhesion protein 1-like isoform X2 [Rana temporaria]